MFIFDFSIIYEKGIYDLREFRNHISGIYVIQTQVPTTGDREQY